jgi:hypothetical protein
VTVRLIREASSVQSSRVLETDRQQTTLDGS